ncbi:MAG: segregation/condensation protein A [Burkholderiales bacterium]|nr:segregation/condensation protein A [Burkholderiales bacterium]
MIVARIHGELIGDLPRDLYIPPEALEVVLDTFEGPLDLLLYLIRKHNLDILDISMTELTRQYMSYIEEARQRHELAAEYLLMAALLIEIKSRMLLPKPAAMNEEEDPRADLVRRLIEYERMKEAAIELDLLELDGRDFHHARAQQGGADLPLLPDLDVNDLVQAWLGLVSRAKMATPHKLGREELSVRDHMAGILRKLRDHAYLEFSELFDCGKGLAALIVAFLALLELARESMVSLFQTEPFGSIYVRVSHES